MRHDRVFPAHPDQIATIRDWASSVLPEWLPPAKFDDVRLVLTELATNSCLHSTSPCIHISIATRPGRLAVTVRDFGPRTTTAAAPPGDDPLAENGRGQKIVYALARRVWRRSRHGGQATTAVLHLPRRPR
ncbi:MAG: ATP-binding protein [Sporichthyaceae bacterium]|nr:ATP-binding protein [Sporichthyaceae bacterium]